MHTSTLTSACSRGLSVVTTSDITACEKITQKVVNGDQNCLFMHVKGFIEAETTLQFANFLN